METRTAEFPGRTGHVARVPHAGGNDHILPPAVQRENYEKNAKHSRAISAYRLFPGRSHYTCGEQGWEAVADFALDWALAPVAGDLGNR
ncbi:hypothetical protein [Burkholderia ambifaria]|uniref:hypothetical protein n=1 Tax=Burkholderia ambifaria TaxID=152480 RepID=UPI00158EFF67|nr:hypothetical protein [Burkholderia ambifaria]UEP52470.1 hypothetical protein LMA00_32135 [Burkholderia ambifaria]